MKIRLIWDECTPTMNRRPATAEDIDNDIHLEEFLNLEDLLDKLLELTGFDIDDLESLDTEERIDELASYLQFTDPSSGSPYVLFLSINNKIILDSLQLEGLNGLTCSEEDVKDSLKNNLEEDELWKSQYDIYEDSEGYYDEDDEGSYDYNDSISYLKENGIEINDRIEAKLKDIFETEDYITERDLIGLIEEIENGLYDDDSEEELNEAKKSAKKSASPLINKLRRQLQEANDDKLTPEEEAYNKASELAKKINKPVVYGYIKSGKFYGINPKEYHGDANAFRSQYSANTIRVAYPDKPFAGRGLQEDLTDDLLDELKEVSKDDNISESCNKEDKPDWEKNKDQILEYYNKVKEWDGDHAKARTSCYYNIGLDTLNEWLGDDK